MFFAFLQVSKCLLYTFCKNEWTTHAGVEGSVAEEMEISGKTKCYKVEKLAI